MKFLLPAFVIATSLAAAEPKGVKPSAAEQWEAAYQERLHWWSLQPVFHAQPPTVNDTAWTRNEVDRFVLASLDAKGLKPAAEASPRALARRLTLMLTGLPPKPEDVERFAANTSPRAYDELVQSLLDSPHFGERWARHWMDVVHYSDTHGYEWDTPAKNAWMYRDYLIRAFNKDVSFKQLVMEQIAGDLITPRIDAGSGLNESIIGPMAMRLGERRHGDNAMFEGITQETMTNIIDTVSKGFLATTVACAQCHDHKLDAVAQRDYYGLAGIFMSTRWNVRCADASDPNLAVIDELRRIKAEIRGEIAKLWLESGDAIADRVKALPVTGEAKAGLPDSLAGIWRRLADAPLDISWTKLADEFKREREKRMESNKANTTVLVDFTDEKIPAGWQIDGFGMKHGLVRDGEPVVTEEGDAVLASLLPAGRWSHVWSSRLAGAVFSPMFDQKAPTTLSVGCAGGLHAAQSLVVDHSFHCEQMKFINLPATGWLTVNTAAGPQRLVYLELVTKSLNNYFPPRTGYAGLKESDVAEPRSWFGVTRVYQHAAGKLPQDELGRFAALFSNTAPQTSGELAVKIAGLVSHSVERWSRDVCDGEDVRLLNDALALKLLPNEGPKLAKLTASYRSTEKKIHADRTVGSVAEWNEGRNERIGIRGSYTEFGDEVPRGNISLLGGVGHRVSPQSSGRLELARSIASEKNPLTARVFVNRVWQHLFGEGLVRTPDDFGHLGSTPSHPELLDYLAARFMDEGWSLKKLVKLFVTSATWRQTSIPNEAALTIDAENRLWHHMPMRRLDAESVRDSMLSITVRLDPALYGPPIDPYRTAQDSAKRLFSGPLDGNGRRSIYTKMTLMEPPRFLALFNQPIPKLTTGKRDVTNVPDQALALLNDPFVIAMAKFWSERVINDQAPSPERRVERMFATAFARPSQAAEAERLVKLARRSAELRKVDATALMKCQPVWQDVAHAIFSLKEFIYVL